MRRCLRASARRPPSRARSLSARPPGASQRTLFEIAREITEVLAGGQVTMGRQPAAPRRLDAARLLFPQVLAVVQAYVEERVALAPGARIEEIGLAQYRDVIVERLLVAIEPDTEAGEQALLPRIDRHRPMGTTAGVQFRTTRKVHGTSKSHISHVVVDSGWEGTAAYHCEASKHVLAYAKNDHLGFEIDYAFQGTPHKYIPDFLVRIDAKDREPIHLLLEIKGLMDEQDRAKQAAAERWCHAVTHHGRYGVWKQVLCTQPQTLRVELEKYHRLAAGLGG